MQCKHIPPHNVTARAPRDPRCPPSPISMLQDKMGPQRPAARCNIEVGVARAARQRLTVGLRPSERARLPTARSEHRSRGRLRAELDLRSTHAPGGLVNHFLHLRLPSWGNVVDPCVNAGFPKWSSVTSPATDHHPRRRLLRQLNVLLWWKASRLT